jgi:hypothetical protein
LDGGCCGGFSFAGWPACFGGGFASPLCFIVAVVMGGSSYLLVAASVVSPSGGIGPGGLSEGLGVVILVSLLTGVARPPVGVRVVRWRWAHLGLTACQQKVGVG